MCAESLVTSDTPTTITTLQTRFSLSLPEPPKPAARKLSSGSPCPTTYCQTHFRPMGLFLLDVQLFVYVCLCVVSVNPCWCELGFRHGKK